MNFKMQNDLPIWSCKIYFKFFKLVLPTPELNLVNLNWRQMFFFDKNFLTVKCYFTLTTTNITSTQPFLSYVICSKLEMFFFQVFFNDGPLFSDLFYVFNFPHIFFKHWYIRQLCTFWSLEVHSSQRDFNLLNSLSYLFGLKRSL